MEQPEERLMHLGRAIRLAEDALPLVDGQRIQDRLLAGVPKPRRRWPRALALGLVLAAAAVAVLVLLRDRPLTFRAANRPGLAGAWIAAPEKASLELDFSDGTVVVLEQASQARVERVDPTGARILLERGRAEVHVVHRKASRWSMLVGPFALVVTGTHFVVRWEPSTQRFTLALHEGAVTLSGPVVGDGRCVQPGERIDISAREGRLEMSAAAGQAPVTAGQAPMTAGQAPVTATPRTAPVTPSSEPPEPAPERGRLKAHVSPEAARATRSSDRPARWRELALDNRYAEAVAAAEQDGFDDICRTSDAAGLRILGDAERLAGRADRARQAFAAVRSRFPRSQPAAVAAFLLGKLSFDRLASYREAASWFATYLDERPDGPLAREAAGRLIESRQKSGDAAGAREAARAYLSRYPGGPHATLARGLVGE